MKNLVLGLLMFLALSGISYAQSGSNVKVIVPSYTNGFQGVTAAVYSTTSTAGSAVAVDITTSSNVVGVTANAGINTAGVQVWVNFFGVAAASVSAGTTAALFSYPIQAGGTSNVTKEATPIPFLSPVPLSVTALSFNCTTTKNGTIGTQVPCNANIAFKQ